MGRSMTIPFPHPLPIPCAQAMFKSFDTNGDGYVSMEELEKNMEPKLRKKIEEKLDAGWKFDQATWDASVARHKKYDMKQIFSQFDADVDGKLDLYEIARAFRSFGLPKRDGSKMEMDKVRGRRRHILRRSFAGRMYRTAHSR